MTNRSDSSQPDKMDAYVDDQMTSAEREAFERQLHADETLRARVEFQGEVDRALRRMFTPSAPSDELIASLECVTSHEPEPSVRASGTWGKARQIARVASWAAAACLVWGWVAWYYLGPSSSRPSGYAQRPLATIYRQRVADGFEPLWVCEDDRQFASTFLKRQGQGLLLRPLPEDTQMVGLAYIRAINTTTTTLMARVDGEAVMVFVERASLDRTLPAPDESSGLHLFRKELAGLVLYELTPLDTPRVMDFLYPVEVPNPVEIPGVGL